MHSAYCYICSYTYYYIVIYGYIYAIAILVICVGHLTIAIIEAAAVIIMDPRRHLQSFIGHALIIIIIVIIMINIYIWYIYIYMIYI